MNIFDFNIEFLMQGKDNYPCNVIEKRVWKHKKKDSSLIYVDLDFFNAVYKSQSVIVVNLRDVTGEHTTSHALDNQKQLFNTVINSTDDHFWAVDANLRLLAFNDAFRNIVQLITGITAKENDSVETLYQESEFLERKKLYECSLKGEKLKVLELREVRNMGNVYVELIMVPILSQGTVIGVLCFARNVTVQRGQEIQLKKVLERFDLLKSVAIDVIGGYDFTNSIIICGNNIKQLFGHNRAIVTPQWWKEQVHPDDLVPVMGDFRNTVKMRKSSWQVEYRFRHKNGQYKHVRLRGNMYYGNDGVPVHFTGAMQDVEEEQHYIQELKTISFLCSHDLRRPIANILGIISLLNKQNFSDPENIPLLELIEKAAQNVDGTLNRIVKKCSDFLPPMKER